MKDDIFIDISIPCGDILELGDDFGDNSCSFCCMLDKGHDGPHCNKFRHADRRDRSVTVSWHVDDKEE